MPAMVTKVSKGAVPPCDSGAPTLVYVREVRAKSRNWLQNGGPVGPVERLDRFRVQVLHGLFVIPAHAVFRARITIKCVDRFGNSHLGGRHCCREKPSQLPSRQNIDQDVAYPEANRGSPSLPSVIAAMLPPLF